MKVLDLILYGVIILVLIIIEVFFLKGKLKGRLVGRILKSIDQLNGSEFQHYIIDPIAYEIIVTEFNTGKISALSIKYYDDFVTKTFLNEKAKREEPIVSKGIEALWNYAKSHPRFIIKYATTLVSVLDAYSDISH